MSNSDADARVLWKIATLLRTRNSNDQRLIEAATLLDQAAMSLADFDSQEPGFDQECLSIDEQQSFVISV